MTWGGGKPHEVGDRGQRYEVTYRDPESDEPNKRRIMGWASTMQGAGSYCDAVNAHPVWCDPEIKDRQAPKPLVKFDSLPLGARFRYPENDKVFVKLENGGQGIVADWDRPALDWSGQGVYAFAESEHERKTGMVEWIDRQSV